MARYSVPENILIQALETYQKNRLIQMTNAEKKMGYEFSSAFVTKMNKLIRIQKKPYYFFINTITKRVALIFLLIVVTMSTTVFSVKALRDPAINFIVNVYEKISTIIFGDDSGDKNENFPPIIQEYYAPGSIPEGYVIKESKDLSLLYQIEYMEKNGGYLLFEQFTIKSSQINIDTEGTAHENIFIKGNPGIYFSNKGYQNIYWNDGVYGYSISGNMPKEKLLTIAESVEKIK